MDKIIIVLDLKHAKKQCGGSRFDKCLAEPANAYKSAWIELQRRIIGNDNF